MWVICEIEGKLYPIKIDVSALPKIWLFWKNAELFCYWPKTNAASKIRYCAEPKSDWNIYKCRILMRGASFETYEAAIEAERISEGYSTLSAFKGNASPNKNDCESETDCESDDFYIGSPVKSTSSYASSVLISDEELVGNDSFEYNERMKRGGAYLMENENSIEIQTDVQLDDAPKFSEKNFVLNSPQCSDYSTIFAIGTGMLTSTLVGNEESDGNFNISTQIPSQIAKIEGMCSSFIKEVTHELQLLKQTSRTVGAMSNEATHSLKQNEKSVPTSNIEILDIEVINDGCDEKIVNDSTIHVPLGCEVGDTTSVNDLNFDDGIPDYNNRSNVEYLDGVHNAEKNGTFTKVQNSDELNGSKVKESLVPDALKDVTFTKNQNPNHSNDSNVDANAPKINLPIKDPEQYKQIEKHFFDEELTMDGSDTELERALFVHLLPFVDETDNLYMDRTIDMVFEEAFFLDQVSWKKEPNRTNLSARSKIMDCWRRSFESKFGQDDRFKRMKGHFRRVKGAKRASKKAKDRRQQKMMKKMETYCNRPSK